MPIASTPRRLSALALLAACACAVPAAAQTFTYTLDPPYQEGVNGANGWYRQNVTATYTCAPAGLATRCGSRSGTEVFGDNAGTAVNPGTPPPARVPAPIVRTATFAPPFLPVTLALQSAPGVGLKVDTRPPETPTVTVPASGAVYDAGSAQTVQFGCNFMDDASGPAANGCVATSANGVPLDTGSADVPATWGNRSFVVTATDLAGNTSQRTVNYRVDEIPGVPAPRDPAAGAVVDARPTFTWDVPTDDGSGLSYWRLRITPAAGEVQTFTFESAANPVTYQPTVDLPAGPATWTVTFIDGRGRSSTSAARAITVSPSVPAAPRLTAAPSITEDTQPLFAWTPSEPGGTFTWQITGTSGTVVQGPATTSATSVTPAPLVPGGYAFSVRQTSALGRVGTWSTPAAFTIQPPAPTPVPVISTATTPTTTAGGRPVPRVVNVKALSPRAGARVALRPVLRWKRARGASLYNLQVFKFSGARYVKVHSAFPRGTAYQMPRGRLLKGRRYVWRVWPYFGATRKYARRPLGISWFDAR